MSEKTEFVMEFDEWFDCECLPPEIEEKIDEAVRERFFDNYSYSYNVEKMKAVPSFHKDDFYARCELNDKCKIESMNLMEYLEVKNIMHVKK